MENLNIIESFMHRTKEIQNLLDQTLQTGGREIGPPDSIFSSTKENKAVVTVIAVMTSIAAATMINLFAIPIVLGTFGLTYWGCQRNKKNKVNIEIRDWYYDKKEHLCEGQTDVSTHEKLSNKETLKWIGWFSDYGIKYINDLQKEITQSGEDYCKHFKILDENRKSLKKEEAVLVIANDESKEKRKRDVFFIKKCRILSDKCRILSDKFALLDVDHQHIQYNMERYNRYKITLKIAVNNYSRIQNDNIRSTNKDILEAYEEYSKVSINQSVLLVSLTSHIQNLP